MKNVNLYIEKMTEGARKLLKNKLNSVILFGSTANGKFKSSKSDVDMIIVVKDDATKKRYENALLTMSKNLSDKYNLGLYYKNSNFFGDLIWRFISSLGVRRSLFVVTNDEIKKQKFFFCDSRILATLLIPKNRVWNDIVKKNKTIYGKHQRFIKKKINIFDAIKEPLPSIVAGFLSILFRPISKKKSDYLKYASAKWLGFANNIESVNEKENVLHNFINVLFVSFKYYLSWKK